MKKNYLNLKNSLFLLTGAALLSFSNAFAQAPVTLTFAYTGAVQTFVVPPCVGQVTIEVWGAEGGGSALSANANSGLGGKGGYSYGLLSVSAGNTLNIYVGGYGQSSTAGLAAGGWNGGGTGYASDPVEPGNGGGGASDIRLNGTALNNRIIVAGGGGGGGEDPGDSYGHGGGLSGAGYAGYDASQTAAGPNGSLGQGSSTNFGDGGGGGGGYYGGGGQTNSSQGGDCQGGGGGSGYIGGVTSGVSTAGNATMPNPSGGTMTGRSGHGFVRIVYAFNGPGVTVSSASTSICNGNSTDLVGGSVVSYTWLPVGAFAGSNSQTVNVSPTASTIYTLQGTNSIGCISTTVIPVTVFAGLPTLTITNSTSSNSLGVCPAKTAVLTAAGAVTYTWAGATSVTNGSAFTPPFSPPANPVYTVSGQNACGITTAVSSISIHPVPTVNTAASANSNTLCSGTSLTLTATGTATNYSWSGGTAPSGNGVGFTPAPSSITYTVIGTSVHGCTVQGTIPVTVHPTPLQLPSASPAQICIGNSSTLTAAGATSYTWASSTQIVYTTAFAVTPTSTGVVTYTVTKANSTCSDTRTISVYVNPLPSVFGFANPAQVCALQSSTLSMGGASSYTWTAPGTPNYSFTGASPVVYPPVSTIYTVAAFDGSCTSITTVSVAVDANPTITISGGSSSLCVGQQLTMTANGGINYTWTAGSSTFNTAQIVVSPTVATQYNVVGDNAAGCVAGTNLVMIVYGSPNIGVIVSKPMICSGNAVLLTASGANSYTWSSNANSAQTKTVTVNPTSPVSGPVVYTVTGKDGSVGCESTKTVQVYIYVPVLSITGVTNTCPGGIVSVNATGGNQNSYSWNTGTGTFYSPGITTNVNSASVFTVSAMSTSANVTCLATQTVAIGIHAIPNVQASSEKTVVCKGESVDLYGTGGAVYTWNNSMSGSTITVVPLYPTNNYIVSSTDGNGCVGTATVQVKMSQCLGINELNNTVAGLMIYPNPNNGEFTIDTDTDLNLTLTNELGQAIRTIYVQAGSEHKVTVNDLSKGIYFLYGQKDTIQIRQKVVVMR